MSVTSHDLKSMLSRVRKPDADAPSFQPKSPAPPPPPVAAVPVPAVAAVGPTAAVEATPTATETAEAGPSEAGSVFDEIARDEQLLLGILGILYRAKKKNPLSGAVAIMPMERELGIARESATFVLNYMKTKHYIEADDQSRNVITVEGIDLLRTRLTK